MGSLPTNQASTKKSHCPDNAKTSFCQPFFSGGAAFGLAQPLRTARPAGPEPGTDLHRDKGLAQCRLRTQPHAATTTADPLSTAGTAAQTGAVRLGARLRDGRALSCGPWVCDAASRMRA